MELKQLEYITAIAEEKSYAKAARRLYVTQSALSQCVSRLEKSESLPPLFQKENGALCLTDAGRIFVNGARAILHLAEKTEEAARQHCSSMRISIASAGEFRFFTQVLPRFKELYPDITLSVQSNYTADAKKLLSDGAVDLAFAIERSQQHHLFQSYPIFEDEVVWVTAVETISADDARSMPVILPPAHTSWRATCEDLCAQEKLFPKIYCETAQLPIILALLKKLPLTTFMLKSDAGQAGFLHLLPLCHTYPYYISVLAPKYTSAQEPVRRLIHLIRESMSPAVP